MKPDCLEDMLAAYAAQPLPPLSGSPAAGVWLEIENRRKQSWWARLFPVLDWREPRMALTALALAVTVGVVPAIAINQAENKQELVRQSIRFDVFSSDTGSLGSVFAKPASLISHSQR
jgi:hypothetical protein